MATTTKAWGAILVLSGAGLLAGCAGAAPRSMAAEPSGTGISAASPASPPAGGSSPGAKAYPTASPAVASESAAPSPDRAGLGTEWGETRTSHIEETRFDRANEDEPFALATIRYNDRDGVEGTGSRRRATSLSEVAIANGAISVALHGEGGSTFPALLPRSGAANGQMNVVGRAGERYTIVVTNHTNRRVEAVATVDGLDVMDGSAGSFAHRGYLVGPYATLEIDGFRKSEDEVAAFRFGAIADSYAAQTGSARDVGVIGVALFGERGAEQQTSAQSVPRRIPFRASRPR